MSGFVILVLIVVAWVIISKNKRRSSGETAPQSQQPRLNPALRELVRQVSQNVGAAGGEAATDAGVEVAPGTQGDSLEGSLAAAARAFVPELVREIRSIEAIPAEAEASALEETLREHASRATLRRARANGRCKPLPPAPPMRALPPLNPLQPLATGPRRGLGRTHIEPSQLSE